MIRPGLKRYLDRLVSDYDHRFLGTDPLVLVRQFSDPEDQEIAGLIASGLAYGNVPAILRSVKDALSRLGGPPASALDDLTARELLRRYRGFRHRFTSGRDLAALLWLAKEMRRTHGTVGGFFAAGHREGEATLRGSLILFVERALGRDLSAFYPRRPSPGEGVRFLLPSPREGSGCKRLNLYMRWMVRRDDGIDLGIWRQVLPRQLLMPVDTHVARIATYIGLTERKSPGWAMTEQITASLRELNPRDPVRYDFALSRLGILAACPRRRDAVKCIECRLQPVCLL